MPDTLGTLRAALVKLPEGAGVDLEIIRTYINGRIEQFCEARPWSRLQLQNTFQSIAPYQTGTVSLNIGSNVVTGVGTTFTAAMTGWRFRAQNLFEYYYATYVSPTELTLDRNYDGSSNLSGVTFWLWQSQFQFPSNLSEISTEGIKRLGLPGSLDQQSLAWLNQKDAARKIFGPPVVWVPVEDMNGVAAGELWPGPSGAFGFEYDYQAKPPVLVASSDPLPDWIPGSAIRAGVQADLYALVDDQSRQQIMERMFASAIAGMVAKDSRKKPAETPVIADRYTVHRAARVMRRAPRWW